MYNLLIVDDEDFVRNAIASCIDWYSLGFDEIFQAEDGGEGLEIIKCNKIDLVLTDIVMPFMDGLELAEAIRNSYPSIKVVILSGYEEFEYAKKSVDFGVLNYILKPVGAATLYQKMSEICKRLKMERNQKQYIDDMKVQLHQSLPYVREKYLNKRIAAKSVEIAGLDDQGHRLGINLENRICIAGLIEMDLDGKAEADQELFQFAVKNIAADSVGDRHYVFDDGTYIVILFAFENGTQDVHQVVYDTLNVIQKAVASLVQIRTTCALGAQVDNSMGIAQSYNQAKLAMECKYALGAYKIYDINDLSYIEKAFYYPKEELDTLLNRVKFMKVEDIRLAMDLLCDSIYNHNLSISNIKMVFIEMTTALLKELSGLNSISPHIWNEGFNVFKKIESMETEKVARNTLQHFAEGVAAELRQVQSLSSQVLIHEVKQYIRASYQDPNMSLTEAAKQVSVSTGYLSTLFKKETGINFVKYLNDFRMGKAMEMVQSTDMKSYEIAYEVGFANPNYFSQAFKKYTGRSPADFRNLKDE